MKKHLWKIIFAVAALLLAGSFVYSQQVAEKANEGVVIEDHIKGNAEANVTLVEYSDFQCPACGQFYPYIKDIMSEYGDDLRFEYRNFPLISVHPYAVPAAKAAEAAGQQDKFWEMHDKLFENQTTWSKSSNPDAFFIKYAEEIGLDVSIFKRHLASSVINDAIIESFKDAQERGLTSTPSFFLNGERMSFGTFEEFKSQIEMAVTGEVSGETDTNPESSIEFGI